MAKGQRRDPKLEAFWRGVLKRFGGSGLSVRAFCRREKLSEPAFYAWRRIVRERDAERPVGEVRRQALRRQQRPPAFVPVVVREEPRPAGEVAVTVEWPSGRTLRLPLNITGERLAELVRAVEAVPAGEQP